MQWVAWVQHLGSRNWHPIEPRSEDFEVVYQALLKFVHDSGLDVRFHILMSNTSPDLLPANHPPPTELRA